MNDIEAFFLLLTYILPFGGIGNIIYGVTESETTNIVLGSICLFATPLIMGYLLYKLHKQNRLLTKNKKAKLLVGMFKQIIGGCILMLVEFLILWHLEIEIRYIILIICISLGIMATLSNFRGRK